MRCMERMLLTVGLALSCTFVFAEPNPPPQPQQRLSQIRNDSGTNQAPTQSAPLIQGTREAAIAKVGSTQATKKQGDQTEAETLANVINGFIAAFTFLLVVIASCQLEMFRRQLEGMGKALTQSSEASAAAKASADAAKIANEVSRVSQRPWVVVQKIIASSTFSVNSGLSFTFVIRNVGNSPGVNVDVGAAMHLPHRGDAHQVHRDLGTEQIKTRQQLAAMKNISFGHLVVPGEDLEITVRVENQLTEYKKAATMHPLGEIIILIVGQVSYRSGIDQDWHESGFMFSVRKLGDSAITLADTLVAADGIEIKRFPAGFYAT